ncbi:EscU/YscU/HrcU family type III secretion system export apparatus switch protein [Buchnera aphidicola]|uniref:Flagellar biosynthetic protein FlhB n=1 Tax=Buchnera aphidicola (Sarucallis kahawaluokalani) TaxID=1241878 RepID=A0A4D6YIZ9_9GAMM|nr:EscU/YscU/HrcU family type III secretion system export apparatus switch protein [Buchnera aphidicola]QCI25964.1 hypothetical protein D9V78_00830 [Buchnera aphidicola (Sarucallis kahawaluokalani)]
MQDDMQEKTEHATYQHLKKAQNQGMKYSSNELNSLLICCTGIIMGYFYFYDIMFMFCKIMILGFSFNHSIINHICFWNMIILKCKKIFFLFLLFVVIYIFGIFLSSIIFNGYFLNINFIQINNLRFYFLNIFQDVISYGFYIKYFNILFKFLVIFLIIYLYLNNFFLIIINLSFLSFLISLKIGLKMIYYFIIFILIGLIPVVIIDILWNKWNYNNQLKMSRKEIEDENKDTESKSNIYRGNIQK